MKKYPTKSGIALCILVLLLGAIAGIVTHPLAERLFAGLVGSLLINIFAIVVGTLSIIFSDMSGRLSKEASDMASAFLMSNLAALMLIAIALVGWQAIWQ